jgi:hypothetical protein
MIEGTPTVSGRYRLGVEASDSNANPVRKTLTLRVKR